MADTPIFYQLVGCAFRRKGELDDLVEVEKEFRDDDPIEARKKAFSLYQSYIDVLLEGVETRYTNYEEAHEKLQDFFRSGKKEYVKLGGEEVTEMEIDNDWFTGFYIYMVPENSKYVTTKEGHVAYEDRVLVHGMSKEGSTAYKQYFENLLVEYEYYLEYELEAADEAVAIPKVDGSEMCVLQTPIFNASSMRVEERRRS